MIQLAKRICPRQRNRFIASTIVLLSACGFGARPAIASNAVPNILFFGNSFSSNYPKDIATLLKEVDVAAGHPVGTYFGRFSSGYKFSQHLDNTGTESVSYLATQTLPAGQTWDYVVMQGNSTEPIDLAWIGGNPSSFLSSGESIFSTIKANNPDAKAVLFETWARNANFTQYYPSAFPDGPTQMQAEVRARYRDLDTTIEVAHGKDSSRLAPVGDAFSTFNFDSALYQNDFYHANTRGELLIALTLYGTIHGPTATELASTGALAAIAQSLFLSPTEVLPIAVAADSVGVREGDTDFDRDVDFDDLLTLSQYYGKPTGATWTNGDFNASGSVDFADLLALAQHYGTANLDWTTNAGGPSLAGATSESFIADWSLAQSLVPEPGSIWIIGAITLPSLRRRR